MRVDDLGGWCRDWRLLKIAVSLLLMAGAASAERLTVTSVPGLEIKIDDRPIGILTEHGLTVELSPGIHTLEVVGPHLKSRKLPVRVRAGAPTRFEIPRHLLSPVKRNVRKSDGGGILEVSSTPRHCEVVLSGIAYRKTEDKLVLSAVQTGAHTVAARANGIVLRAEATVLFGQTTRVRFDFESRRVEVEEPEAKEAVRLHVRSPSYPRVPLVRKRDAAPAPLEVGGDVRAPVKISGSENLGHRESSTQSIVDVFDVIIDEEGRVEASRLRSTNNRRRHVTSEYLLRSWRFQPATRQGEPVAVYWRAKIVTWIR